MLALNLARNRWVCAADMAITLASGPEIVWRDAVQNKFFDALAAGIPVADNFHGWQTSVAIEAGAGLELSSDDYDAAAETLVTAMSDPEWMKQASQAARQLAQGRFNRDRHAEELRRVLERAYNGMDDQVVEYS